VLKYVPSAPTGAFKRRVGAGALAGAKARFGGRGEIRTHEGLAPLPVFKTGALNHSATLPTLQYQAFGNAARLVEGQWSP
jgi:hypothetical protein